MNGCIISASYHRRKCKNNNRKKWDNYNAMYSRFRSSCILCVLGVLHIITCAERKIESKVCRFMIILCICFMFYFFLCASAVFDILALAFISSIIMNEWMTTTNRFESEKSVLRLTLTAITCIWTNVFTSKSIETTRLVSKSLQSMTINAKQNVKENWISFLFHIRYHACLFYTYWN